MNRLLDALMLHRAGQLAQRLSPHLPAQGNLLDIGSGTGHNGRVIERKTGLTVTELDVVDMNCVGRAPRIFDGVHIPFMDQSFDAVTLLFVLHYASQPARLLREAMRVSRGPLIVLQSVYTCAWGSALLRMREWGQGRGAYQVVQWAGLLPKGPHPLSPRCYHTHDSLRSLFASANLAAKVQQPSNDGWPGISRELIILERIQHA